MSIMLDANITVLAVALVGFLAGLFVVVTIKQVIITMLQSLHDQLHTVKAMRAEALYKDIIDWCDLLIDEILDGIAENIP